MNIQQAKNISMIELLARLGIKPERQYSTNYLYLSPLRNERKPSFSVSIEQNLWVDISAGRGGDIINFVQEYFGYNVEQALKKIAEIMNQPQTATELDLMTTPKYNHLLRIHRVKELQNIVLVNYLESRQIPVALAKLYLKDVYFYIRRKHLFSLGWQNANGGWELRNSFMKTATSKAITFISGKSSGNGRLHIFEGMMDFLSALVFFQTSQPNDDTIVLNSTKLARSALPRIQQYEVVNLFLDNDTTGTETTHYIANNHPKTFDRRGVYSPYNDFNDFLVK